jgi:hypothetical protein
MNNMLIENKFIPNFFKDYSTGRFLEIGAENGLSEDPHEPVSELLKLGWAGVYCEPNPYACSRLLKNLKSFNNTIVVNGAIDVVGGLKKFYIDDAWASLSSLDKDWIKQVDIAPADLVQEPIITNTFTIQQLTDAVGLDFNCISIDIENTHGFYEKIVDSFDWRLFTNCKMIVIELCTDRIQDYFISIGYTCAGQSAYNTIFIR